MFDKNNSLIFHFCVRRLCKPIEDCPHFYMNTADNVLSIYLSILSDKLYVYVEYVDTNMSTTL